MRSLEREEAREAMSMMLAGEATPEQLGAFLMLMRVKEETAEEVAGFTEALREHLDVPETAITPAIDWAAYAGKKRQLPWFLMAALILGKNGYPVFMHGLSRRDERLYVPEALARLGLAVAGSLEEAARQVEESGFAYIPIERLSATMAEWIAMRDLFGLRPPLNTVARMLNPLAAPLSLMGVFHPNFAAIHQRALGLLEQPRALVVKGEGGEFEFIPERDARLFGVAEGKEWTVDWPTMLPRGSVVKPAVLDLDHFRRVWEGEASDHYGELAVTGTLAMAILALGVRSDRETALALANSWWRARAGGTSSREAV